MKLRYLTLILAGGIFTACSPGVDNTGREYAPNMYHSVPYEPLSQITNEDAGDWVSSLDNGVGEYYNSNPNNPNGMTMRVPPENVVKRSKHGFLPYRIPKDSLDMAARLLKNPLDSNAMVLAEGKALYTRFCSHCHGDQGTEPGKVGEVFGGVTSYQSAAVKDKSEGHLFHVITNGKGRMGAHGSQLSPAERWKIVRYVQVLQKQ